MQVRSGRPFGSCRPKLFSRKSTYRACHPGSSRARPRTQSDSSRYCFTFSNMCEAARSTSACDFTQLAERSVSMRGVRSLRRQPRCKFVEGRIARGYRLNELIPRVGGDDQHITCIGSERRQSGTGGIALDHLPFLSPPGVAAPVGELFCHAAPPRRTRRNMASTPDVV